MAEAFSATVYGDLVFGPVRSPRNSAIKEKGSIHDDETAQKLGFRGGTVAGSLHMEQFPPLLAHLFGGSWWETGGLSLYFRYATTDLEGVQAGGVSPKGDRTEVWMDKIGAQDDGQRVADGTANIGGADSESALSQRINAAPKPGELRILEGLKTGTSASGIPAKVEPLALDARLKVITEPLEVYLEDGPWGRAALPPSLMVRAMRAVEPGLVERMTPAVGLYGAIEVQHLAGPVFADVDYEVRGTVLAVSDTPKTEYFWYESILSDSAGDIARMLMMLRFMKASSPLWEMAAE